MSDIEEAARRIRGLHAAELELYSARGNAVETTWTQIQRWGRNLREGGLSKIEVTFWLPAVAGNAKALILFIPEGDGDVQVLSCGDYPTPPQQEKVRQSSQPFLAFDLNSASCDELSTILQIIEKTARR